jgi:uncharacterized membrane protein YjjP (DUF1212 family)
LSIDVFFVASIAAFVVVVIILINKGFSDFFVCLFAAVNNVKIRIYRGRITYGQEERQQLNSIVVIVQSKLMFLLVP